MNIFEIDKEHLLSLNWIKKARISVAGEPDEAFMVECTYNGIKYDAIGYYYLDYLEKIDHIEYKKISSIDKFTKFYNNY